MVITHHDSYKYAFKRLHFSVWFLVIEFCSDVHKLVVVRSLFVLADYHNFILGF